MSVEFNILSVLLHILFSRGRGLTFKESLGFNFGPLPEKILSEAGYPSGESVSDIAGGLRGKTQGSQQKAGIKMLGQEQSPFSMVFPRSPI